MPKNSKYVEAAFQVLDELGGGPISSRVLIAAIVEKGLLEDRKYLYHNVLRKVRESDLFDTSKRGFVSLAPETVSEEDDGVEQVVAETLEVSDAFETGTEEVPAAESFSGPGAGPIA